MNEISKLCLTFLVMVNTIFMIPNLKEVWFRYFTALVVLIFTISMFYDLFSKRYKEKNKK